MAATVQVGSAYEIGDYTQSEAKSSAVTWGAVIAGAFVTAALSLILMALGVGVGLSATSVWAGGAALAHGAGVGAIVWLIVTELLACGMGGYLAGRLRTKWVALHTHEVYFRDTAHGFLVWAVSLVISAAFLATTISSMVGGAAGATSASSSNATAANSSMANAYFADSLFRTAAPTASANDAATRTEANLVLLNGVAQRSLTAQDRTYLAELVSAKTGMRGVEAERRVDEVFNEDLAAADAARKAAAHSLYWMFVAFLIGAFVASHAATVGGRQRDRVARAAM